jgi:MarR family transcriptional regulator, 2-MHQ and catechol-resistance regulon repressor
VTTVDPALALWLALGEAHAALSSRAHAHAARHGFSLAELAVLGTLHRNGRLLLGELQRHTFVSSGGATFLVDRLEAKGLVRRQSCPDDRRATYAVLTTKGVRRVERLLREHAVVIRRAAGGMSASRQRAATALLRALTETVTAARHEA